MKVAIRPCFCAMTLAKVLKSAALSADASALSKAMAASSTPGPVSSCSPSIAMSISRQVSSSVR